MNHALMGIILPHTVAASGTAVRQIWSPTHNVGRGHQLSWLGIERKVSMGRRKGGADQGRKKPSLETVIYNDTTSWILLNMLRRLLGHIIEIELAF